MPESLEIILFRLEFLLQFFLSRFDVRLFQFTHEIEDFEDTLFFGEFIEHQFPVLVLLGLDRDEIAQNRFLVLLFRDIVLVETFQDSSMQTGLFVLS